MTTMHAVVAQEAGGPEVLSFEEVERPEAADGRLLVEVHAIGVNPVDWKIREGSYGREFPTVLGSDVSGVVQSGGGRFEAGDEVFGFAEAAYAEYVAATAEDLALKPKAIDHAHAAGIPVAGLTAWQALFDRGGLERGQTVLIAGAAGGVGHFAVQFAKHAGAHVIGTGSGRSRDFVLGLGADEFVDYATQDAGTEVSDAHVVFDAVGGDTTATLVPALGEGGVLVTIAGAPPEDAARERGARAELLVMARNGEQLQQIADLIDAGAVRVEIADTLPLREAARAHELSQSGRTRGKLILTTAAI